jgi:hypothetical protein
MKKRNGAPQPMVSFLKIWLNKASHQQFFYKLRRALLSRRIEYSPPNCPSIVLYSLLHDIFPDAVELYPKALLNTTQYLSVKQI